MSKLISKNSKQRFKQGGSNSANRIYTEIYDTDTGVTRKGYTMDGEFYEFSDEALRQMSNSNKKENPSIRKKSSTKRPISKFTKAFNEARARGDAFFTFGGQDYSTQKKGEVMDESKWGTEAYKNWKTPITETPVTETPVTETPVTETPVTETPTINKPITNNPGYYAIPVDYDNAENFNQLGIKDYNTLKQFVIDNPRHQFSQDMIRRFKNTDQWTQNDIESALKVKGKYRSGYQGDLYDIRKSMKNYIQNNPRPQQYVDINDYMIGLESRFPFLKKRFKNGGLISRNPITRFKQGGMLRKLQNGYKIVGTDDQGQPIYQAVDSNAQAQIEAQAAKEVQDFLNSLRASKQQQEQEFSPVDAINTWKDIITIPKKEVTQVSVKSQKKASKNNSNYKKNKGSQSQKKITVTTYAKDPAQFPVDPMPPISQYEAPQWGRIYTPIAPYQKTRPYSVRQQGLRPNRYGLGDDYYKKTMGFVAP